MNDIEERLTIEEIKECKNNLSLETKRCKRAASLCFQVGTVSASTAGISFLFGLINFVRILNMDKDVISIWLRIIGYLITAAALSVGYFSTELAREALLSAEDAKKYVNTREDLALLRKEQEKRNRSSK